MVVSHVIVMAGNYGQNTFFHGEVPSDEAVANFQAEPMEGQPAGSFRTILPAFQVLNLFSQLGYSVLGMSGNGACQTSWVLGKQQE